MKYRIEYTNNINSHWFRMKQVFNTGFDAWSWIYWRVQWEERNVHSEHFNSFRIIPIGG